MKIRIGTRGSDLALWQANYVADALRAAGCEVEIDVMQTRGDRIDDVPLQNVEGKAFFTAEIEQALAEGRVDVAVHSHKDLPVEGPPGLAVVAIPPRANCAERLVMSSAAFDRAAPLLPLVLGARVGTSSPRRAAQLRALRPDLEILDLRGNVPTRVRRLAEGRYDAILLAAAGLDRLDLDLDGLETFDAPTDRIVPAPGQGALAIQARADDQATIEVCRRALHEPRVESMVRAERNLLALAGGGCNLALGAALEPLDEKLPRTLWRAQVFRGPDAASPARTPRWATAEGEDLDRTVELAYRAASGDEPTRSGPLAGLRVALTGSSRRGSHLGARLASLGADVTHERVLRFETLDEVDVAQGVARLASGDVVAVTSRFAASLLCDAKLPAGVRVAAVGAATKAALLKAGVAVDLIGSGGARALATLLVAEPPRRVFHPCAEGARRELQDELEAHGIDVERVELYRTLPAADPQLDERVDMRVYMSPSAVEACTAWEREHPNTGALRVAFGPTTAEALAACELAAIDATGDPEDVVRRIVREHREVRS